MSNISENKREHILNYRFVAYNAPVCRPRARIFYHGRHKPNIVFVSTPKERHSIQPFIRNIGTSHVGGSHHSFGAQHRIGRIRCLIYCLSCSHRCEKYLARDTANNLYTCTPRSRLDNVHLCRTKRDHWHSCLCLVQRRPPRVLRVGHVRASCQSRELSISVPIFVPGRKPPLDLSKTHSCINLESYQGRHKNRKNNTHYLQHVVPSRRIHTRGSRIKSTAAHALKSVCVQVFKSICVRVVFNVE